MKGRNHACAIDFYAYNSPMRAWNPILKVWSAVLLIFLCIILDNMYASFFLMCSMSSLIIWFGKVPLHEYRSLLKIPLFFLLIGSVALAIEISAMPMGFYFLSFGQVYIGITEQSVAKMFHVMANAFAAISALYMMTLTTPMGEVITVLRKARIPHLITELMFMIYRFIFILLDTECRIRNSAESRLGYCDFPTSCRTFGDSMGNLLVLSLQKSRHYFNAMESRCYDGVLEFLEEEKKIKKIQLFVMSLIALLMITIAHISRTVGHIQTGFLFYLVSGGTIWTPFWRS